MPTKAELTHQVKQLKTQLEALESGKEVIDIIYPNVEKFVQWEEMKSINRTIVELKFRIKFFLRIGQVYQSYHRGIEILYNA